MYTIRNINTGKYLRHFNQSLSYQLHYGRYTLESLFTAKDINQTKLYKTIGGIKCSLRYFGIKDRMEIVKVEIIVSKVE